MTDLSQTPTEVLWGRVLYLAAHARVIEEYGGDVETADAAYMAALFEYHDAEQRAEPSRRQKDETK